MIMIQNSHSSMSSNQMYARTRMGVYEQKRQLRLGSVAVQECIINDMMFAVFTIARSGIVSGRRKLSFITLTGRLNYIWEERARLDPMHIKTHRNSIVNKKASLRLFSCTKV